MVQQEIQQKLRLQMPVVSNCVYLDHAAVGPLTAAARSAIASWLEDATASGDVKWPQWYAAVEATRRSCAALINASPDAIALVPNTTFGINVVATCYPWQAGESVVVPTNEFPSNRLPWTLLASRGVVVRNVEPSDGGELDAEKILAAADETTRLISISWVGYSTGFRCELGSLIEKAHDRGIQVFVDAIQGLGASPLDVAALGVDYLAADGHKWMLGPEGAGFMYIAENNLLRLAPLMTGWNSVHAGADFDNRRMELKASAARYEGGTANMAGFIGLGASLQTLMECGCSDPSSGFADVILDTAEYAANTLRDLGARVHREYAAGYRSGIISFELPGCDPAWVRAACLLRQVICSVRHRRLRIAVHAYNTRGDIDALAEVLRACRDGRA